MIEIYGYHNWAYEHFKTELGYKLNSLYKRRHYMEEGITTIFPYAFSELNVHRI